MTTWITRFDPPAPGVLRVAVKDAIDVAGTVTTAGCVAVRDRAVPAASDAVCCPESARPRRAAPPRGARAAREARAAPPSSGRRR